MKIDKQPISVLVVIHSPDGDILLLERAGYPNYWQSVTGSREGDELLPQTAQREVAEETGIIVPSEQFLDWQEYRDFEIFAHWRHRFAQGVTHNREHRFSLCVPKDIAITIAPGEHTRYQWCGIDEAATLCFSWTNKEAILALPSRINNRGY